MVRNAVAAYRSLYGRKLLILALAAVILALATACSWYGQGIVVEKELEGTCHELKVYDEETESVVEGCVQPDLWNSTEVGESVVIQPGDVLE